MRKYQAAGVAAVMFFSAIGGAAAHATETDGATSELGGTTLAASGKLLLISDNGLDIVMEPGETPDGDETSHVDYAVVTSAGQVIPIEGDFAQDARSGDAFEGVLVVPDAVATEADVVPGSEVPADSSSGVDIVEAAADSQSPLKVESAEIQPVATSNAYSVQSHTFDIVIVDPGGVGGADPAPTITPTELQGYTTDAAAFWSAETNGAVTFPGATSPSAISYVSSYTCTSANRDNLWNEAAGKFGANNISRYLDGSTRHHLVVFLPGSCASAGKIGAGVGSLGSIHSGGVLMVSDEADTALPVFTHELGHNVGLGHSNLSTCGTTSYSEGAGCTRYEYLDTYSVMGAAIIGYPQPGVVPAPQRDHLQGFPSGSIVVQPATSSSPNQQTTYSLAPISDADGLQTVKVIDPIGGGTYYVELRSGTARDAGTFFSAATGFCIPDLCGVVEDTGPGIRVLQLDQSAGSAASTVLSVNTGSGDPGYAEMAFEPGEQFVSRSGGVRISVNSLSPSSAPTVASVTITTTQGTSARPTIASPLPTGKNPSAISGTSAGTNPSRTVSVFLDGSSSPFATVGVSGSAGNWSVSLASAPDGFHTAKAIVDFGTIVESSAASTQFTKNVNVQRLTGIDRYGTGIIVAGATDYTAPVPVLFLTTGQNYPDALSAGPAAVEMGGPVMLIQPAGISEQVMSKIVDLQPQKVYVLGATNSVSAAAFNQVVAALPGADRVVRLTGINRYETSELIAGLAFSSSTSIFVSNGANFPDALSAGGAAATVNAPVLMVPGAANSLPASTIGLITGLGVEKIYVTGAANSVSDGIFAQLSAQFGASNVKRITGVNRYGTSQQINEAFFTPESLPDPAMAIIATGEAYPDALVGSSLAGNRGAPLYITPGACLPQATFTDLVRLKVTSIMILGGYDRVTTAVENFQTC